MKGWNDGEWRIVGKEGQGEAGYQKAVKCHDFKQAEKRSKKPVLGCFEGANILFGFRSKHLLDWVEFLYGNQEIRLDIYPCLSSESHMPCQST